MIRRRWIASTVLLGTLIAGAASLAAWKAISLSEASAAAAAQPEPMEAIRVSVAKEREHQPTTTAIGTVVALRSISLRNELPGTVRRVQLTPGQIVEAGTVLVALDTSVEEAELKAQEARAELAQVTLNRIQKMSESRAASQMELDSALAERDVALAEVARIKAVIARKTIRAPFRAYVGISDVHPGQYLNEGTQLTTLQGVDDAAYVDFPVAQHVAAQLRRGTSVQVYGRGATPVPADIVAIDARVDPQTRNALVRARITNGADAPAPGASVRVAVPMAESRMAVTIPVNALRKGPEGDHVFVVQPDGEQKLRASLRRVVAGDVLGSEVVIEEGLNPGERVAASGSFKLREQALVAVLPATQSSGG